MSWKAAPRDQLMPTLFTVCTSCNTHTHRGGQFLSEHTAWSWTWSRPHIIQCCSSHWTVCVGGIQTPAAGLRCRPGPDIGRDSAEDWQWGRCKLQQHNTTQTTNQYSLHQMLKSKNEEVMNRKSFCIGYLMLMVKLTLTLSMKLNIPCEGDKSTILRYLYFIQVFEHRLQFIHKPPGGNISPLLAAWI